jgi:Na+/H+ antiporter NhaD/arsenite permease-like protein
MKEILLILVFVISYTAIALESKIRISKAGIALLAGTLSWVILMLFSTERELVASSVTEHMGGISGILFFLLGAMTIVELMDSHDGFEFLSSMIRTGSKRRLLVVFSLFTFFLSALLDNLTTTIVMITLMRKSVSDSRDRWLFASMIIIAANSGGAWSPMGDVTTTMLWIGHQISAFRIIAGLFLPSLVSVLVPLLCMMPLLKGNSLSAVNPISKTAGSSRSERKIVFFAGITGLLAVPFLKTLTGLPPFMGMILVLGALWVLTEILHRHKPEHEKGPLSLAQALRNLDTPTILFFLGILLSISALETSGLLAEAATFISLVFKSQSLAVLLIGLLSAIVDNVPLIAALQGMYPLSVYPTDHFFWEFLAYAVGTGGSILIIGSAAGVAAMGMENITFTWYLRRIAPIALAGYLAGAMVYIILTL